MIRRILKRRAPLGLALVISLAATGSALAGGFYVSLERPAATSDPRMKDAVLVVRAEGCIDGSRTRVSVTAEGIVKGERRSIPVPVTRIATDAHGAAYAVRQQWPTEGAWVLVIRGAARHTGGAQIEQYRLLAWEPAGWAGSHVKDLPARTVMVKPAAKEIHSMLQALGDKQTASARARGIAR